MLGSGDRDSHWRDRFFLPYEEILRRVPFYPTLGNHDCGESEASSDLEVYLDNFFFPSGLPSQYYGFSYANFADFFALDSTGCTPSGDSVPQYLETGEQFQWLKKELSASKAPWKIPYFHHPPFTAGPTHAPRLKELQHFVRLFQDTGVEVVFNGHEHNFQYTAKGSGSAGDVTYVVTGAGGELRDRNITTKLSQAGIAAFANQRHFTVVEIEGKTMRITPVGDRPVQLLGPDSKQRPIPVTVNAR
jgi:tartrate-resistant acid phosphatase type 5